MTDETDPTYEWYGAEIIGEEELDYLLETIGLIDPEVRAAVYSLFVCYRALGSRPIVVFEYNFIEEEMEACSVLPIEIFEKMWEWKTQEYDLWNEVKRRPIEDATVTIEDHIIEARESIAKARELVCTENVPRHLRETAAELEKEAAHLKAYITGKSTW